MEVLLYYVRDVRSITVFNQPQPCQGQ